MFVAVHCVKNFISKSDFPIFNCLHHRIAIISLRPLNGNKNDKYTKAAYSCTRKRDETQSMNCMEKVQKKTIFFFFFNKMAIVETSIFFVPIASCLCVFLLNFTFFSCQFTYLDYAMNFYIQLRAMLFCVCAFIIHLSGVLDWSSHWGIFFCHNFCSKTADICSV